jgi:hypothetical protein
MTLTVIVPTYRRHSMLRSALQSIAGQSRVDLITEVLVSENSEEVASREVCSEFGSLPIRWVQQQPAHKGYTHFAHLLGEAKGEFVCMLGDDDLWSQSFLQVAWSTLHQHQHASAFLANAIWVRNESCRANGLTFQTLRSLSAGFHHPFQPARVITAEEMLTEVLLGTPFSLWTMLARREVARTVAEVWTAESAWDADRLFLWRLAQQSIVVHSSETLLYNRHHPSCTSAGYGDNASKWDEASARVTQTLIAEACAAGMDARALWEKAWHSLDEEQKAIYRRQIIPGAVRGLVSVWGNGSGLRDTPGFISRAFRALCPPLIYRWFIRPRHRPAKDRPSF